MSATKYTTVEAEWPVDANPRNSKPNELLPAVEASFADGKARQVTIPDADEGEVRNMLRRAGKAVNCTVRVRAARAEKRDHLIVTFKAVEKIVRQRKSE